MKVITMFLLFAFACIFNGIGIAQTQNPPKDMPKNSGLRELRSKASVLFKKTPH